MFLAIAAIIGVVGLTRHETVLFRIIKSSVHLRKLEHCTDDLLWFEREENARAIGSAV